jgi:hypothetical protein
MSFTPFITVFCLFTAVIRAQVPVYANVDTIVARLTYPTSIAQCREGAEGTYSAGDTIPLDNFYTRVYFCGVFKSLLSNQQLSITIEGEDSGATYSSPNPTLSTGAHYELYHYTYVSMTNFALDSSLKVTAFIKKTSTQEIIDEQSMTVNKEIPEASVYEIEVQDATGNDITDGELVELTNSQIYIHARYRNVYNGYSMQIKLKGQTSGLTMEQDSIISTYNAAIRNSYYATQINLFSSDDSIEITANVYDIDGVLVDSESFVLVFELNVK